MKIKIEDLESLESKGLTIYDIGYRGGTYGLSVDNFIDRFMPKNIKLRMKRLVIKF